MVRCFFLLSHFSVVEEHELSESTSHLLRVPLTLEVVVQRCSVKKVFLKISQNSQESTCTRVSFLIKLQARGLQLYLERDSGTGTHFSGTHFLQNTSGRLQSKNKE